MNDESAALLTRGHGLERASAPRIFVTRGSGNSYKPFLVAHQLGLQCDWVFVDVLGGQTRTPEFLEVNPRGQVPFMVLSHGEGLAESNAIAWYLAEGSALVPAGPVERAQALQWMFWEQTCLEPFVSPARFFTAIVPQQRSEHEAEFPGWLARGSAGLAFLDEHLRRRDFLVGGAYSIADVAVYGYAHVADEGGFRLAGYPCVAAWMERVQAQAGHVPMSLLAPVAG